LSSIHVQKKNTKNAVSCVSFSLLDRENGEKLQFLVLKLKRAFILEFKNNAF
jgi:hypothetical protein